MIRIGAQGRVKYKYFLKKKTTYKRLKDFDVETAAAATNDDAVAAAADDDDDDDVDDDDDDDDGCLSLFTIFICCNFIVPLEREKK